MQLKSSLSGQERELIARVSLKGDGIRYRQRTTLMDANADSVGGKVLTAVEKKSASGRLIAAD